MANSQQKNHPNERMKKTSVFRDADADARRDTSSAKSETRVPSDARVTATPASAARGSEGASGERELRKDGAAAATAARRRERAGSVVRGGEVRASARGKNARARDTWCLARAFDGGVSRGAGDGEDAAKVATKRTNARTRAVGTKPVRRREGDPRARRGGHGACEGERVVSER